MRLNFLQIALFGVVTCCCLLQQLMEATECTHTVVDETIDCFGFAHDHGKLTLEGVQLVDNENSKYLDILSDDAHLVFYIHTHTHAMYVLDQTRFS